MTHPVAEGDAMASDHALRLGKLIGNLQSLEVLLRVYLLKVGAAATAGRTTKKPNWDLVVGETVDDDEFSNYDTLGQLVAKYNQDIAMREPALSVDTSVIAVRDLLAHGRVAGTAEDTTTLKAIKFHKPQGGKAVVSMSVLLDDAWFDINIVRCLAQIKSVAGAIQKYAA
jgi:hypothetical protein